MLYSTFNQTKNNQLEEPIFLGQSVNLSRFDQQRFEIFEKLAEKSLSFFWRPEEIDLIRDRVDFGNLSPHEQHIFLSNLKYQSLLDSVQGRSPNIALLPMISIPELEGLTEIWSFFEVIHSRSYTHIVRNIVNEPQVIFDSIIENEEILKRAKDIAFYYDDLIECYQWYNLLGEGKHQVNGKIVDVNIQELKKKLILCLISVNALEGIRFYVSFACSFNFAERKLMEGNAKIIRMIARDEAIHLNTTQTILNIFRNFKDDADMSRWLYELEPEIIGIYQTVADQEKEWAKYLFKDGSMVGLNESILCDYVEYLTDIRMQAIGLTGIYGRKNNPLPWMNNWLSSDAYAPAPQETELTSYLVGQINASLEANDFDDFEL